MISRVMKWVAGGRRPWPQQRIDRLPLLDQAEVLELYQRLGDGGWALEHEREVAHRLIGDARSVYRGTGLDYEESRPYQVGDELRFMNWRLTARTGELHVKVFREERRPGVFVVVDRRSAMRFGTRVRLKAAQAARAAVVAAFAAQLRNMPVGGVVLDPQPRWIPSATGEQAALNLITAAAAPCPPIGASVSAPALSEIMKLLQSMLVRGTVVYLLSDLLDLDESCRPTLLQLALEHQVCGIHIVDPAETALPPVGRMGLRAGAQSETISIDTLEPHTAQAYADAAQAHLARRREMFVAQGIAYVRLSTVTDSVENEIPIF